MFGRPSGDPGPQLGDVPADPATAVIMDALQRLLDVQAVELRPALVEVADAIAAATGAEKVDAFLHDPASGSLNAVGVSRTPLGRKQQRLGLDRLPVVAGGRFAAVFTTGVEFMTGHAEADQVELPGIVRELGVRSSIVVPLDIAGERRGVLALASTVPDAFGEHLLRFARSAARWTGTVAHRAEILERLAAEATERGRREAAEELITVVAHDLRNFIAPIHARIVLMKQRAMREQATAYQRDAELAQKSLNGLTQLLSALLDVSRIDQGLFEVQLAPTELVGLVREVAAGIGTPDVPIAVQGEPEILAEADPPRLRQALENLLSNAVKHSPPGVPVLAEVSVMSEGPGLSRARVRIEDRGPGMDADLAARAFTRFARGARSSGLGLGLYLAREIVRAHGGTLELDTAPGKGARFLITLPPYGA